MEFEEVYKAYFGPVYRYLLRLSGSEQLAEELAAETFFRALRAADGFRGGCEVRVWLCQIAKNAYYTHQKKSRRARPADGGSLRRRRPGGPAPVHRAGPGLRRSSERPRLFRRFRPPALSGVPLRPV